MEDNQNNLNYTETQWNRREYHNNRVYWNFELFVKFSMAICAGFAYLSVNEPKGNPNLIKNIIIIGCVFEILIGVLSTLNIISHYRAKNKILPGDHPPVRKMIWSASDFYMILAIIIGTITKVSQLNPIQFS